MKTVFLLIGSNLFMTAAWYGHLKHTSRPLWQAIVASWLIAFFEYCLQVPANRIGYSQENFSAYQLKIIQEVVSLSIFVIFALVYFKEWPRWNHILAFVLILGAVYLAVLPGASDSGKKVEAPHEGVAARDE